MHNNNPTNHINISNNEQVVNCSQFQHVPFYIVGVIIYSSGVLILMFLTYIYRYQNYNIAMVNTSPNGKSNDRLNITVIRTKSLITLLLFPLYITSVAFACESDIH